MDVSVVSQTDSSIQLNYKDVERETDEQNVNSSEIKSQEYQIVKPSDSDVHEGRENAAPLGLDAITSEQTMAKSQTQEEVITMLLAQHGIIPSSDSIDVAGLNAQDSLSLHSTTDGKAERNGEKPVGMHIPPIPHESEEKEEQTQEATTHQEERIELERGNQSATDDTHPYLSSIATSDIGEQIEGNSGYEVTAFVAEDGQGRHIIISGGPGYQDSSVVSISGHQVVSSVNDNQLMTITSGGNSPVSMAGLESFGGDHVRIGATDNDDGNASASYYVLEGSVPMSDTQSEMEPNEQDLPKKVYQCSMEGCQKQFSTPYRLKAHGRSHSGQTFQCDEDGCQKTFITPGDLNKHSRTHSGEKPFFCDVDNCGKVYSTPHHLKVHKRSHTGDKPFVCEWESCGKSFSTGYGLKSHYRTHTGERPYKCPEAVCDKAFKTSGDLQKHIRTHTGERPFKCLYEGCVRSFTTSNIRKVHMRTHSGERPYVCEIEGCNRSFASATNYKNHSRIHTGERPYACEVPGCNKSFTEYSSLYKHNVVHTQQKPYVCNICHKTYRQTSTLAMHKRSVHGAHEDNIPENGSNTTSNRTEDLEPDAKRQKTSFDSNVALTTALVQGLPVMLNDEGTMNALQTHYAELAAQQQLNDGSSVPGAIAIPIQVTMNPDGTIAGAQGISLTDSSGRVIPVSLSLTLPISHFANSLSETTHEDSIVSSEAVAAASAVNEIFTNQQTESAIDVQLSSDHVITEQIENHDVITPESEHTDNGLENTESTNSTQIMTSEGLGTQILIKPVTDASHGLITSDSESTSVRITPRNYDDPDLQGIEETGNESINGSGKNSEGDNESAVAMIINEGITHEQEEADVTDRYLIKESLQVGES